MNKQKIIIGLFAIFGLLPISWADSLSTVALQRDEITKYNVYQAVYILMGLATDADADGYFETPAILAGTGPAGGGLIPTNSGAPLSDGYGNLLGYCAWDNGATTNAAGHIAGSALMTNKTMAIVAPGIDGIFDSSCASIFSGGGAVNDDYVLSMTAAQVALGVGGANDVGKAVGSVAALNALSTTSIPDGQIRLATDTNSLYRWSAGTSTWVVVSATPKWLVSGSDLAYSAGNVGIGGYADAAARFHVQNGLARFDGGINVGANVLVDANRNVTANSLTFVDSTGNRMVVNQGGYGIGSNVNDLSAYVAAGGTFSVRQGGYNGAPLMTVNGATGNVNSLGGYSVGGVAVIDSARNIANVAALTASGVIAGGSFASAGAGNFGSLQIGGVGVIDAARNVANVGNITASGVITATGYVNTGSGFQVGGVTFIDSSRNIGNVGTVTATAFVGALNGNALTASNISNTGTVTLASPTESNSITITQPAYTTDKPVKLLNFNWYSDTWSLGNIRGASTPSNGFGVYLNGAEQVRFIPGGGVTATTGNFSGNVNIGSDAVGGGFTQRAMNGWMDVLQVYRGGALKWALQDSSGTAKFTSGLQLAGNLSVAGDGAAYFGPNSTWGATLRVGGNGGSIDALASVATTDGNLHLDAATVKRTYLNYYKGTGGVGVYNGLNNGGLGTLDAATINAATGNYSGTVTAANLRTSGSVYRSAAGTGYMDGQFNVGGETSASSGPIYTIGGGYVPSANSLGNMYGIGYGISGQAGIGATGVAANNWGLYVAAAGVSRIFLSGETGNISANGSINSGGTIIAAGTVAGARIQSNAGGIGGAGQAVYDMAGGMMAANTSIYSYGKICSQNNSGDCSGAGGTVLNGALITTGNISTTGAVSFGGAINTINGITPPSGAIRLTPNLHLNSGSGNAVILNWDNGTTGNTDTLRIGNGAGTDVFKVTAAGDVWAARAITAGTFNGSLNGSASTLRPISGPGSYKLAYTADSQRTNAGEWGRVVMLYDGNGQTYGVRVDRADYADSAGAVPWSGVSGKPAIPVSQDGNRYATDFNGILNTGFYNGDGTPANSPVSYGQLIVARGPDTGFQIAGGYNNDNMYFRGFWSSGAGFSPWRTVIHSGNIGSQSVNYATSAGAAASLTGPAHVNGTDGWFRSGGQAGWFNESYGVGVYASQAGRVDLYNGAALYVPGYITAGGDINGPSANFGGGAATFNSTAITFTTPVVIAQVASNGAGCSTPGGLARDGANDLYICK